MEYSVNDPNMIAFVEMLTIPIRVELNPLSSPQDRQEAHRLCEKLRTEEPPSKMSTAAIMLLGKGEIEIIYAGFRILEDTIRFHWHELTNQVMIKTNLMSILANGFPNLPSSPVFLQEALARNLVEIAKREWPQLWPDLIPTLFGMGHLSLGPYIVMRRFFEDIILFERAENSERKRDLTQGFTVISTETVSRLFCLIIAAVQEYELSKSNDTIRKCKVLMGCLLPFLETASLDNFLEPTRINILFKLLKHPELKTEAADSILLLVQRRPRKEDKYEIVNACLQIEYFQCFIEAINNLDEFDSHFLKQLCDILSFIAGECTPGKVKEEIFFSTCEILASRKEATAVVGCVGAINIFLRNLDKGDYENFRKSPMAQVLIKIVDLVIRKLVSAPDPDEKDEFIRLKSEAFLMLRNVCLVIPNLYIYVNHWIQDAHNANIENYQWDILNSVFDALTSSLPNEDIEVVRAGLKDLELCFKTYSLETNDLKRKSVLLSSVSALFTFLTLARKIENFREHATNMLYSILKSLFQCLRYPETEREIRRHVAALFIKLTLKNTALFVDIFESIYEEATSMKNSLTVMEYKNIIEALVIVSNEFPDKTKQLQFIGTILPQSEWLEMSVMCNSTNLFSADPSVQPKRPLILRNLNILQIIFKRVKFPKDSPQFTEAVFNHIRPTLPVVLELVKLVHSLVSVPEFSFVHEMSLVEKHQLLGTDAHFQHHEESASQEPPKIQDQLKHFAHALEDSAYNVLGSCCIILSSKIYSIPNLTDAFLNYVGGYSQLMTDYQIRNFVRTVYKNFLLACPFELTNTVVVPFLQQFGPFMMSRLLKRWETVEFESKEQENTCEEKEIVETTALRYLTKEYFDILVKILERSKSSSELTSFQSDEMDMDGGGGAGAGRERNGSAKNEAGEVGLLVLSDPVCFESIIYLSINALIWKDSLVNFKAVKCIQLAWPKISLQPLVVVETFKMALTGILILSNQEPNVDLLLKLVDTILLGHKTDPTIIRLFIEWGAAEEDVKKVLSLNPNKDVKKRKDMLKKIVKSHPLIDQNPKSDWLTPLPTLNIYKPETKAKEIDLHECFSLIHQP